jgi:cell division protein FtsB
MSAPDADLPAPRRRRRRGLRRWTLAERRGAVVVAGLVVAGWLAFVFAGTLGRADDLEAQAQAARAQVQALEERLALGREEVAFVASDAFVEQSARGLGWGAEGEVAFALPDDAPPPSPLPLLGAEPEPDLDEGPLGSLLRLFSGF